MVRRGEEAGCGQAGRRGWVWSGGAKRLGVVRRGEDVCMRANSNAIHLLSTGVAADLGGKEPHDAPMKGPYYLPQ